MMSSARVYASSAAAAPPARWNAISAAGTVLFSIAALDQASFIARAAKAPTGIG